MARGRIDCRDGAGWVLVDLLVALALTAVLLGSLAAGISAVTGRSTLVAVAAEKLSVHGAAEDAWMWAFPGFRGVWLPGPALDIELLGDPSAVPVEIGAWSEGWLVAQQTVGEQARVVLGGGLWSMAAGKELTVRARAEGREWGPPWRTLVPDTTGTAVLPGGTPREPEGDVVSTCTLRGGTYVRRRRFLRYCRARCLGTAVFPPRTRWGWAFCGSGRNGSVVAARAGQESRCLLLDGRFSVKKAVSRSWR